MYRFIAILATLAACSATPERATVAAAPSTTARATVSVTANGVRLSLSLPRSAYPFDSLVPAVVRLTNLTSHSISAWGCPSSSLGAEVVTSDGVVVYPPLLPPPGAPWTGCPDGVSQPHGQNALRLAPGRTTTRTTYIVTRSPSVRAWANLRLRPRQRKPVIVATPYLDLQATVYAGPQVRLRTRPTVAAVVTPAAGAGPILYSEYAHCHDQSYGRSRVRLSAPFSRWIRASTRILIPFSSPPCASLVEWDLFVAQAGRPVAHVYYCAHRKLCHYWHATPPEQAIVACKRAVAAAIRSGRLPLNVAVARYALGLKSRLPARLTKAQRRLAQSLHTRCAPLLHRRGHS